MKRIGLIALALVLALGGLGVGFAQWTETLSIDGDAETGDLAAMFRQGVSNDDGQVTPWFCINGYWLADVDTGDNDDDPAGCQVMGQTISRPNGNVAQTAVSGAWDVGYTAPPLPADHTQFQNLNVSVSNAYPSYYATVFFNIMNVGTIPCKVQSITVTEVSVGASKTSVNIPLTVNQTTMLDCDGDTNPDLSVRLSNDLGTLLSTMGTSYQNVDTAAGDLCIHVEDGAEENTTYDFTVTVIVVPFNK